jgi:soluble lytic murein transglycosylase-like protein
MLIFRFLLFILLIILNTAYANDDVEKLIVKGYILTHNPRAEMAEFIADSTVIASQKTGIPVGLLVAIQQVESNFDIFAISPKSAYGLMQVHYPTWAPVLENKIHFFVPYYNVLTGAIILKHYIEVENGNLEKALYRYLGIPEVKNYNQQLQRFRYLKAVLNNYKRYLRFKEMVINNQTASKADNVKEVGYD